MNYKLCITVLMIPVISLATITFSGLTEEASINKNRFLCPSTLQAEGDEVCQDRAMQAVNFKFDGPKTLQLFNNQQYWVQQKYKERQLLMAGGYNDGSDLDSALKNQGWTITGGFLIVITTDSFITDQVEPQIVAAKGQVKVVAQLWYNGDNLIQLWAQDDALIGDGQSFSVSLSSTDSVISQEPKSTTSQSTAKQQPAKSFQAIKQQFLQEIELSPRNILMNDYNSAVGSPKNIKIVIG